MSAFDVFNRPGVQRLPVKFVEDAHGAPRRTYGPPEPLPDVDIQPMESAEDTSHREGEIATATLFGPLGIDLAPGDRVIEPEGREYTVVGPPARWRGVGPEHTRALLRDVEG